LFGGLSRAGMRAVNFSEFPARAERLMP